MKQTDPPMKKPTDINNNLFGRGCCHEPGTEENARSPFSNSCAKLSNFDFLKDIPQPPAGPAFDCVEVRFKSNRKEFMRVTPDLNVSQGDIVAVEGNPGHDIGIVTLTGYTAQLQMKAKRVDPGRDDIKKVYRLARPADIEKWVAVVKKENEAVLKTRRIAGDLNLGMKVNDVEFQGDGSKAIFYYTADDRVDFRELIKVLAEQFRVRIEMKQIGIRQEASRVGGIGPCGRELCCATWIGRFRTVSTTAAKVQQLSLNPQKLAGQCGKLKCCLNYEYDAYVDAIKEFPPTDLVLKTRKGEATCQKIDVFKRLMWYAYLNDPNNLIAIPLNNISEISEMNRKNKFPEKLEDYAQVVEPKASFEPARDLNAYNDYPDDED